MNESISHITPRIIINDTLKCTACKHVVYGEWGVTCSKPVEKPDKCSNREVVFA